MAASKTSRMKFLEACLSANNPSKTSRMFIASQMEEIGSLEDPIGAEQQRQADLIGARNSSGPRPSGGGRPGRGPSPGVRPGPGPMPRPARGYRGPFHRRHYGRWSRGSWFPAVAPLLFPPPPVEVLIPPLPYGMPPDAVYYDDAIGLRPGWMLLENGWAVPIGSTYPPGIRVIRRSPYPLLAEEQTQAPQRTPEAIAAPMTPDHRQAEVTEKLKDMLRLAEDIRIIKESSAARAKKP